MVAAWVASPPCKSAPPLSGGIAVAVSAASLPAPAGVSAKAYRRISVPPAADPHVSLSCRIVLRDPGSKTVSQRFHPSHQDPFLRTSDVLPAATVSELPAVTVPERVTRSLRAMAAAGQASTAAAGQTWLAGEDGPLRQGRRPSPEPGDVRPGPARLLLMVGLPGAGKTTRAKELAAAHRALRLTPDEWMISLFGEPEADGKRDLLEGRLIAVALQALRLGTNVVLDFGFWSRDERSALRWLATSAGASSQVIYLPVGKAVQRARIAHRQATAPHTTFPMTEADIDSWRRQFQAPDAAELSGGETVPGPPPGWPGWPEWARDRWPSLGPPRPSA